MKREPTSNVIPFAKSLRQEVQGVRVVSMSAESAKVFMGFTDEPEDLGPPHDPDRYKPGARVFEFKREPYVINGDKKGKKR